MKKPIKKIVSIVLIVVVLVILCILIYKAFMPKTENLIGKATINEVTIYENTKGKIEEYDKTMYIEGYKGKYEKAYYITGTIVSNVYYNNVIITFNVKDRKGNIIGSAVAGLTNVQKGKEYNFKALSTVEESDLNKIHSYEVVDIRGE